MREDRFKRLFGTRPLPAMPGEIVVSGQITARLIDHETGVESWIIEGGFTVEFCGDFVTIRKGKT